MTRNIFILLILASIGIAANCRKTNTQVLFTGMLVVKEHCDYYMVQVIDEGVDGSLVVNDWWDEKRQKFFNRVFTLGNNCDILSGLAEGEKFVFRFDPGYYSCRVCGYYYPVPVKINNIKVYLRN